MIQTIVSWCGMRKMYWSIACWEISKLFASAKNAPEQCCDIRIVQYYALLPKLKKYSYECVCSCAVECTACIQVVVVRVESGWQRWLVQTQQPKGRKSKIIENRTEWTLFHECLFCFTIYHRIHSFGMCQHLQAKHSNADNLYNTNIRFEFIYSNSIWTCVCIILVLFGIQTLRVAPASHAHFTTALDTLPRATSARVYLHTLLRLRAHTRLCANFIDVPVRNCSYIQ